MKKATHSNIVFLLAYIGLFALLGTLFWPFVTPIIFACILAGTFYPAMMYIIHRFKLRRKWAALIICILIVAAVLVPSIFLVTQISQEAFQLYQYLRTKLTEDNLEQVLFGIKYFPEIAQEFFDMVNMEYDLSGVQNFILDGAKNISSILFNLINSWITNLLAFLVEFLVMLVVIFGLLVDGPRLKRFALKLSPMPDEEEELVIQRFNQMNFVTIVGNGIGGMIQGGLCGVGFWMAGIESVALWTTAMTILAFIPLVGHSMIYIPACIYFLFSGEILTSLVLLVYCLSISLIVENWFKPRFVGNKVEINSIVVFLSIIGGLSVFGIVGIFYGPLIISTFLTFVSLYHKRYTESEDI